VVRVQEYIKRELKKTRRKGNKIKTV
jgi:hypothetical protein